MSVFRFDLVGVFLSVFAVRNFFSLCLCLYQINGIFTQKQLNENTQMCKWNSNSIESNSILFNSIRMNQDRDKSIYWAMLWRNDECLDSQNLHNFVDRKLMAQQDDARGQDRGDPFDLFSAFFLSRIYPWKWTRHQLSTNLREGIQTNPLKMPWNKLNEMSEKDEFSLIKYPP